jgi:hypothetical protein
MNYLVRSTHYNGYDAIPLLRSLRVWTWLPFVTVRQVNEKAFVDRDPDSRYIFVVIPNATNTSLIWGFGLHGNGWPGASELNLCYVMPSLFFHIPGLRELLLWSGAVTSGAWNNNSNVESRVLDMTRLGRNVAYAPNGMEDALFVQDESHIHARRPSLTLFQMACDRNYQIVPCLCSGENDRRYILISTPWIRGIQRWMLKKLGYPFPLIYFPDLNAPGSRRIEITMGEPLTPPKDGNAGTLQTNFFQSLQQLNNNGVDKELILKD